jgi:hypothetical protein
MASNLPTFTDGQIYRNRNLSSIPDWQDGDVCEMSNFASYEWRDIDNGKKVTFINCNLLGCKTTLEQPKSNGNLTGEPLQPVIEPPPTYPELAANAEIVLYALKGKGTLTAEQEAFLEQLAAMTKAVSGTDAELGQIATEKTIEMIDTLKSLGYAELADMMQQALQQIQAGWGV